MGKPLSVERLKNAVRNLCYLPSTMRLAWSVVSARADIAQGDFRSADRHLKSAYSLALPSHLWDRSFASLLMARVALKLGRLREAAEIVPDAVHRIDPIRTSANEFECAYLKYAGRLILEEATDALGDPMTLNVGIDYSDLDVAQVRRWMRAAHPIERSRYSEPVQLH